ncbi:MULTISPECIES: hypothetical protein [Wolbachia]|uniref:hypothetical protein n=1 Tax=Wolbachia TaxID=953 RepID=UPI00024041F6|nr:MULTISPECIES: hypothetical protein [Wolbachia]UYC23183.1 hypothetical protein L3551_04630 [Wolbachia endosymbiont of Aedes aegypti]QBB83477.1 hypothetical protein DEJ70_01170 [Wolbachia pipientis wAlbB]QDW08286.1 hypothetical protein CO539_001165 [Wolbachia pipientis]QDW09475.1 hypothetical protein CO538_001165 [Wolbachia pipientis]QZA83671.1 hypothetical protein K1Y75_01120 [Wolbachia pipientis]
MNPRLRNFLIICGSILLLVSAIAAIILFEYLLDIFTDMLFQFLLAKTSSEILAFLGTLAIFLAVGVSCYGLHKLCSIFTERITRSYQSFKNENSNDNIFSEVYNDPTIGLKDKILFFSIYSIYCIQLPFLYCASKISELSRTLSNSRALGLRICLVLINTILLIPVALLELIKYPLIKLFSPLGLSVKQMSFLFNVSDVGAGSQSVHTSSFEYSILQCAQDLKQKFGNQSNVLNKDFEDYINNSDELTGNQQEQLKLYLNFNGSNGATYRESRTELTLTQAANLVLAAAKNQKLDVDLLKCMLLMRLQEGSGACHLGMFNRIIYSLSCLEAKNNFTVEVNAQVYERMPSITEEFLNHCESKKMKILKDNFDNFYSENDMDLEVKDSMGKLMEEAKQFVFNKLYVDYYNRYGQEVGRGPIKQKLKELITDEDIKEAVSAVIDNIEIPKKPSTYLEKMKAFFAGHTRFSAA